MYVSTAYDKDFVVCARECKALQVPTHTDPDIDPGHSKEAWRIGCRDAVQDSAVNACMDTASAERVQPKLLSSLHDERAA